MTARCGGGAIDNYVKESERETERIFIGNAFSIPSWERGFPSTLKICEVIVGLIVPLCSSARW